MAVSVSSRSMFLFFLLSINLISCGGGDSSNTTTSSDFVGDYIGTYDGTDTGNWDVRINADDSVIGSAKPLSGADIIPLRGNVGADGNSTLTGSAAMTVTFNVTIDANGKVTGNWNDTGGGGGNIMGRRMKSESGAGVGSGGSGGSPRNPPMPR